MADVRTAILRRMSRIGRGEFGIRQEFVIRQ
jgi:hypothetical protein